MPDFILIMQIFMSSNVPIWVEARHAASLGRKSPGLGLHEVPPLARGAGGGCESPIIKHSVDNILLLIVLINPLLGTFSVLKDIFNYVVTL
jgi:hypothetical protein